MSFNINSDKEQFRGSRPQLIGDNELTIRGGTGSLEREIVRTQLDAATGLPRVGINRTGERVNNITVTAGGSGYTTAPSVIVAGPATATAFVFNGQVTSIAVNDPGSGYTTAPDVLITGGGGQGAAATAVLDTVDFELDINGAIRTSTSIISDTARVLNLDIDNFVTPDLNLRGPNLKTYANNSGTPWAAGVIVQENSYRWFGQNIYQCVQTGETGSSAPVHLDGIEDNGTAKFKHIGFRVDDSNAFQFGETGDAGVFPRSITPLLGDRSDKIATTEYVLNLATNDVGGRIYVSQQIGSDLNDGRSAVNPVRTIKKAAQLAWSTPGVKETIIVSGGDYVEDNPISLPPDCSVVGDNLRLVIVRPANPGKHMMKFGDKNYVIGLTYRDQIDSNGDPVATCDFAMVFDDKQRIIIDKEVNGDFGVNFPIGHQIFGPDEFRVGFQQNTGLSQLASGLEVVGVNTGARAKITDVTFAQTTGANAYTTGSVDVRLTSGSFVEGERFTYLLSATAGSALNALTISQTAGENKLRFTTDPTSTIPPGTYVFLDDVDNTSFSSGYYEVASINDDSAPTYWEVTFVPILNSPSWDTSQTESISIFAANVVTETFDSVSLESIRAEGEVVSVEEDFVTTLPISRIDFSLQGDPSIATGGFQNAQFGNAEDLGGIVFYTNALVGRTNTHEFKEGQEIVIENLPTSSPDLSLLNGKQRIYKVLEDADGRARRFVIPKKIPSVVDANFDPGTTAVVKNFSRVVTLSLLNSPNSFPLATPVERRYQDACNLIRNNREFIADEVVGRINDEFKHDHYAVYNVGTDGNGNQTFDIYLGPTQDVHTYVSGGTVTYLGVSRNITGFTYDNVITGVATITLATGFNTLPEDAIVKLADILLSCDAGQKVYPAYSSPTSGSNTGSNGDEQCRQDVVHFLNALVRDLEFGSNHNIIDSAKKYIVGGKITYIEDEIIQNVRAIEYARELAIYAMCNWRTGNRTTADPNYVPQYSSLTRYFDDSIITATAGNPACDDVRSAIDTLSYLWVDVISNNATGTYLDAAYLIARNRDLIADQALADTETAYPALGLSDVNQRKCRRDINIVLGGLIKDLVLGGNNGIVSSAESYFEGTALSGIPEAQRPATLYAFQRVTQYAQDAMRNWTSGTAIGTTPVSAQYNSSTGQVSVTINGLSTLPTTSDRIAFAEDALVFSCDTGSGPQNHASPDRFDSNYGQSYAITAVTGTVGNPITITCTVPNAGTAAGVVHTFVSAKTDATIVIYDPVTVASPIPKFEDWNIGLYSSTPLCSNVASTITTAMGLFEDILDGTILPGATTQTYGTLYDTAEIYTYPDSYITDQNNVRMAVRGDFDEFPIIEASPYTQNASVISFLGGGGALVDGSKVKQPNCPFPGLELDGTASFPNQGKSMVASAFTIVSFGGTGYKVINDGYTQLVSVFVIFCSDGVLAESGGYCSITNSATNFGQFALRAKGFRAEEYTFDVGTVTNVSATPTGRTILTLNGLGREPLEHYIVKVDGHTNTNTEIEYFVDAVGSVTVGPPFSAQLTIDDGTGGGMDLTNIASGQAVATSTLSGATVRLHRPSIVNSSSHTWEFAGSGTNYLALPENGGTKVEANEQVSQDYGRVYCSGTDELGDFKVGTFAKIENRTGAITFTGTVTISEVEFLKLKGGDVVVTGFDASNTLGGANASDSKIPTQKAVRDYITNNLGPYINKPYSTNAVPRALVELTDSGKISIDQIPALRPFEVYTVADQAARLAIEGALAGDIAIQQDTQTSFILNNDLDSLFAAFNVDPTLQFTNGDIFIGSVTGGRLQATEYRQGVVYQINITDGGSGYVVPPTVTISGGNPGLGAIAASASCTIANGEVVTVTIDLFNGYYGGKGYTTAPEVNFSSPPGAGTAATGNCLIESRLYGDIVNQIAITDTDTIDSSDTPAVTVNLTRVINTSASDSNNWVSLSSNQIAATDITSGVIETDRLATGGSANSFTFLRGDQNFALAVQSLKGAETRYFAILHTNAANGSSQLVFTTNSNVLIGHEVSSSVTGIQANTNVTGVLTSGGLTTVSLNNPLTSAINAGTLIEFERGTSPMLFESTYTQGNFVDSVIIVNGGSGFTDGQYFDVGLSGGNGTGLRANITVSGNAITEVVVTDGGTGYSSGDFSITLAPNEIGSGSSMVLEAKISTVNRQYANVGIDVLRVTDLTISSDEYGTIGVSRFRKDQFNIGQAGNGSVQLKTGADSGLDADLLDGAQGSFYLNSGNQNAGTLPTDRLSGTYNISISNQSGSTLRLVTGTNNPTSNPTPNNFVTGIVSNTINNNANGLSDGGSKNLVITLRPGGSGFTVDGGVKQLAFTDNDNMYLRGSGTGVTTFGSWAKIWSSLNDGIGSGLDADRLDNKQGIWYQNAYNVNKGVLAEQMLPRFIDATTYRDSLTINSYNGDLSLRVYISGQVLNTSPFTPGSAIKFYDSSSQAAGDFTVDNLIINNESDNTNDFTILIGRLTSGTLATVATATQIGTASNRVDFDSYSLDTGNSIEIATLKSNSGTAELSLGRTDGSPSSPAIYFNSSSQVANFNVSLVASGGNATDGSGTLNASVANADGFTINGQKIWNAGNITFQSSNIVSTAVLRDASGNFSAGTITANITGASSFNVLKTGDTMTGSLTITGNGSNFSVSGTASMLSTASVAGDFAVDTDTLFVDESTDRVGINAGTAPVAPLDVRGDGGIMIRTTSNAPSTGARIRFSDETSTYAQQGTIRYNHSDTQSPGSTYGESFTVEGTESTLAFDVDGDIIAERRIGVNVANPDRALDVGGAGRFTEALTFENTSAGQLNFNNNSSTRYWRVGSNTQSSQFFTFEASDSNGSTTYSGNPALAISGTANAVAINTTATSGTDPTNNATRNYILNVNGDMNIDGQFFQNNQEFVTSRWTQAPNNSDIYRTSKVGIGFSSSKNPAYALDVEGGANLTESLRANGDALWLDTYGVIGSTRSTLAQSLTIPSGTNARSNGPLTVSSGNTITVSSGASWTID